jgi:hypothetical protein
MRTQCGPSSKLRRTMKGSLAAPSGELGVRGAHFGQRVIGERSPQSTIARIIRMHVTGHAGLHRRVRGVSIINPPVLRALLKLLSFRVPSSSFPAAVLVSANSFWTLIRRRRQKIVSAACRSRRFSTLLQRWPGRDERMSVGPENRADRRLVQVIIVNNEPP